METQYGACQAAIVDSTKEYLDYQKKKDDKMTQLKATRDQRLKQTEQSGKNFWELCRTLEDKKKRLKDSVMMTRMKVAADRIKEDWGGNTHRFADDEFDKILLVSDKKPEENSDE
jgi:septal ring factor EnvC (AmiA/AmiB activator)